MKNKMKRNQILVINYQFKRYIKWCVALLIIIIFCNGCGKGMESAKNKKQDESNTIIFVHSKKLLKNNDAVKTKNKFHAKITNQSDKLVKYKAIKEIIKNDNTDPRTMTKKQLKMRELKSLGIDYISPNEISEGFYNETEAANVLLDYTRELTSNDIVRLKNIDMEFLQNIIQSMKQMNNNSYGLYSVFSKEKLEMLYKYFLNDSVRDYLCIWGFRKMADITRDSKEKYSYLEKALDIAKNSEKTQTSFTFISMADYYKSKGQFDKALQTYDEGIQYHKERKTWRLGGKGLIIEDKIRLLAQLGRKEEARVLLKKARKMEELSDQNREFFNAENSEYEYIDRFKK